MDLQKLIKRKKKAESEDNKLNIATASNDLGNWYNTHGDYENALEQYKCEAKAYTSLGLKLETAKAHRMISEMYMLLSDFSSALKHEEIHLGTARELDNTLEEQRALATVGRIHLLHGQSVIEMNIAKQQLKLGEKAFMKSLLLCESLKGKVPFHELMDMRARLLLNLGVVLEHLENFERSVEFMDKAIAICIKQELYELLHQCYLTKGLLLHQRQQDFSQALNCFNKSLDVAERLPDKVSKECESLMMKAEVFVSQYDLQSAKQVLIKAWKLKCLDENDKKNVEKKLKIVSCMCYTEDALISTKITNYEMRKLLNEKMGDGYCWFKKYSKAITYYLNMLECAKLNKEEEKDLIPIYVSLYQTYRDNKQYDEALKYYWKEFDLCSHIPREAFNTLINISEVLELANKQYDIIEPVYIKARQQAKKLGRVSLEILCIEKLINLKKLFNNISDVDGLRKELSDFKNRSDFSDSSDSECTAASENTPCIGDDICIEDLSDICDSDGSEETGQLPTTRKRNKLIVKKNNKGETQLHTACISGNIILVQRLLNQNHPVNIRDHAGWLPLHEACLHGHKDVVEMLLDKGAHINDRGGTNCDGITPLCDAASNGHLEIIELLLDRGANAKLLTDQGQSALDILITWKQNVTLTKSQSILYQSVFNKLKKLCTGIVINETLEKNNSSKSPIKLSNEVGKLRFHIDDFSDMENDSSNDNEKKESFNESATVKHTLDRKIQENACLEYKNVMKSLRKHTSVEEPKIQHDDKKKSAFLEHDEVGDDWLEDDLQYFKTKRRKVSNTTFLKEQSTSSTFSYANEISNKPMDISKNSKSNRKRKKTQSSLLDSGFSRSASVSPVFNIEQETVNVIQEGNVNLLNTTNVNNVNNVTSNVSLIPPIPVKVRIEDRLLVVPIMSHLIDSLNIAWLSKEASKRYYNLVGLEPCINLMMPDGALLSQDDPLSLVLNISELKTQIIKWNLPPLHERYLEACSQLNIVVDSAIQTALNVCQATQSLDLSCLSLSYTQIQPVIRCLNHQANLQCLILSGNIISDEGVKLLCSTMHTIKQLKALDLSVNNLTHKALFYISELCDKVNSLELQELNMGFNPLGDNSWIYLSTILNKLKLKKLVIPSCDLQEFNKKITLPMHNINHLDISFNELQYSNIFSYINGDIIINLNLSNIKLSDSVQKLIEFLSASSLKNLTILNLSGCDIGDSNLVEILHPLLRAENLDTLILSNNFNLSSISLRRLMQHRPCISNIILEGCVNIVKYLSVSNVYESFDNIVPERILLSVDTSTEDGRLKSDIIREMWEKLWSDKANVKFGQFGLMNLSINSR